MQLEEHFSVAMAMTLGLNYRPWGCGSWMTLLEFLGLYFSPKSPIAANSCHGVESPKGHRSGGHKWVGGL